MSLGDFLEWMGRPGAAARNVAAGRPGAALRQLGQFTADPLDMLIPGDNFHIASSDDEMSGRDLLDQYGILDKKDEGILPGAAGIAVDVATDPLTYLGGGLISRGAKAALGGAEKVVAALPAAIGDPLMQTAKTTGNVAADYLGWDRMSPAQRQQVHEVASISGQSNAAMEPELQRILAGSQDADRIAAADIIHNINVDDQGIVKLLDPERPQGWGGYDARKGKVLESIRNHPAVTDANRPAVTKLVSDALDLGRNEWEEGVSAGSYRLPDQFKASDAPGAYLPRHFNYDDAEAGDVLGSLSDPMKARSLKTDEQFVTHLNEPGNLDRLDRDLANVLAKRGQQQGKILQQTAVMKKVLGDQHVLSDSVSRGLLDKKFAEMIASPDSAIRDYGKQMETLYKGMEKRGGAQELLATANRIFKKPATMGVVIPNAAFFVRNRLGMGGQGLAGATQGKGIGAAISDTGLRNAVDPISAVKDLYAGIRHGVAAIVPAALKTPQLDDEIGRTLDAVSAAFKASGGRRDKAIEILKNGPDPMAHELVTKGIIDGNMMSADDLVAKLKVPPSTGVKGVFERLWNSPAEANQAMEDRMRGGYYVALRKSMPEQEAARRAIEDLVDYRQKTKENRLLRDIVPFGAFASGTIPKIAGSGPTLALGNALMGHGEDDPIYPYMEGKANIPLGLDEKGNAQYMTSLGLPVEAIGQLDPTMSNMVSQMNPLLKTGYMMLSGEDPYFRTPYGSYDKMPFAAQAMGLVGEDRSGGDVGALINKVRGTGITMPLESILALRQVDPWLDPRNSTVDALLKTTTGAKITSVDPDLAQRQQVEEWLRDHPREVKSYETFYTNEHNPELDAMLQKFKEAKARLKEKRDAAKVNGIQ